MKTVCPGFMLPKNEKYFVGESGNYHLTTDAPIELIEEMRNYRKKNYNDEFVYGNPVIHSETKDGIHLDK